MNPPDPLWSGDQDVIQDLLNAEQRWEDACLAARLLALAPQRFSGLVVRGGASPARDKLLHIYRALIKDRGQIITLPPSVTVGTLEGEIDAIEALVDAEYRQGDGSLMRAAGGSIIVRMANMMERSAIHTLSNALDTYKKEKAFQVLALDESEDDGASLEPLRERLAFSVCTDGIPHAILSDFANDATSNTQAKERFLHIKIDDEILKAICAACSNYSINSLRAHIFVADAARGIAALRGAEKVMEDDLETAARLVLVPRITQLPDKASQAETMNSESQSEPSPDNDFGESVRTRDQQHDDQPSDNSAGDHDIAQDTLIEVMRSGAVSLAAVTGERRRMRRKGADASRTGARVATAANGRPSGSERGDPRRGRRLDLLATLRAAVPWQRLRPPPVGQSVLRIYPSDLRVTRYRNKSGSSIIFVVDASGSNAMRRLGEVKGAVESLLGECYSRRDLVSLIICRGTKAEIALPPSRSLTRARRAIVSLPGGGGTPLASAIGLSFEMAIKESQDGREPLVVFLTDGKGNIALDGTPNRQTATSDAERLARLLQSSDVNALFFDTSPRTEERAAKLCQHMGGRYIHLPYANQGALTSVISQERQSSRQSGRR